MGRRALQYGIYQAARPGKLSGAFGRAQLEGLATRPKALQRLGLRSNLTHSNFWV